MIKPWEMGPNFLRFDGTEWDGIRDLAGIQDQKAIKHKRMGQEETVLNALQIRYAS